MDWEHLGSIAGVVLLLGAGVAVLVGNIYYVIRSKTSKIQKEQIEKLQNDNEACTENYDKLKADFHELKGTVSTLRDVPLQDISQGMKDLTAYSEKTFEETKKVSVTNGKILDTLKKSALIRAEEKK